MTDDRLSRIRNRVAGKPYRDLTWAFIDRDYLLGELDRVTAERDRARDLAIRAGAFEVTP